MNNLRKEDVMRGIDENRAGFSGENVTVSVIGFLMELEPKRSHLSKGCLTGSRGDCGLEGTLELSGFTLLFL